MVSPMLARFVFPAFLALCAAAPRAGAHPHVFVDVGLRFETDAGGAVTAVEVTWAYDALFTLLILSDYGLDGDADMVLTGAERARLKGFDLTDWPEGFEGALFLRAPGGEAVTLGPPEALSLRIEGDRLITRHRRPVAQPVAPDGLVVRPYDPSYYAALTLSGALGLPGGCEGRIDPPDRAAADALVESLGGAGREAVFEDTELGVHYADTLVISCAR